MSQKKAAEEKSPAWRGKRELIKRKVRRPSNRSLAAVFGTCSANSSPVNPSEIFTESSPLPTTFGASQGFDVETVHQGSAARNPFKRGSPTKKRRKPLQDAGPSQPCSSTVPLDWDDETANDAFCAPLPGTSTRSGVFTRTKSAIEPSMLLSDYALDFSGVEQNPDSPLLASSKSAGFLRPPIEEKSSASLPLDNRLGTRLRITSSVPFPWMEGVTVPGQCMVRISGKEQHEGTKLFVDLGMEYIMKPAPSPPRSSSFTRSTSSISPGSHSKGALLMAASLYWQFPVLPWLSLFPRLSTQTKKDKTAPPLAPAMIDTIIAEWTESFETLYLSWKKGDRHSFYVCCPNVTAHFTRRKEEKIHGDAIEASMSCFQATEDGQRHAVFLSSTTSGFRRYLREQGIQVEVLDEAGKRRRLSRTSSGHKLTIMDDEASRCSGGDVSRLSLGSSTGAPDSSLGRAPISFQIGDDDKENSNSVSCGAVKQAEDEEKEEDEDSEDDTSPTKMGDAHSWLKGIGVSPASTLKMRRHNTTIPMGRVSGGGSGGNSRSACARRSSAETTGECPVLIREASSVQALFNLLLESKAVRAIAGTHASLPPTLLASQPFVKAQLQTLKKTSQVVKKHGKTEYVLEMDGGPIMPHAAAMAASFARACLDAGDKGDASSLLRVNDRAAYVGLNALQDGSSDWTEMNVTLSDYRWKEA